MNRAFTMVELIVVVVILGIIAGVIAPRLAAGRRDGAEAAERTRRVVSALGRRDLLTTMAIALEGDEAAVRLLVPAGDERNARDDEGWREDPLVPAAELAPLRIVSITANGTPLDARQWRIIADPGFPRPHIVAILADDRAGGAWRIELAPQAIEASAARTSPEDRGAPRADALVDLDASGGRDAPW